VGVYEDRAISGASMANRLGWQRVRMRGAMQSRVMRTLIGRPLARTRMRAREKSLKNSARKTYP
jgi:hypothetical protein